MIWRIAPFAMLLLAACAASPDQGANAPSTVVVQEPLQPDTTGPVDGIYRGRIILAGGEAADCPSEARGLLEIGDRMMHFAYSPDIIFVARFPSDGRLHVENGSVMLDGRLVDGDLDLAVVSPSCRLEFNFRRLAYF